jgi:hypothetical protein
MEYTPAKSLIDLMPHNVVTSGKDYEVKPTVIDKLTEYSRLTLPSGLVLVKYTDGSLYTLHTTDEQYSDWECVNDPVLKAVLDMLDAAECRIHELQREKVEIKPAADLSAFGKTSEQIERTNLQAKAMAFTKLRKLLGYIENGTDTTVKFCQDDATRKYIVKIGNKHGTYYCGDSLELAIEAAHKASQDN